MNILYGLLVYLLIGFVYSLYLIAQSVLTYPRVMTKGGFGRALNAIPHLETKIVSLTLLWILVPIGAIFRAIRS